MLTRVDEQKGYWFVSLIWHNNCWEGSVLEVRGLYAVISPVSWIVDMRSTAEGVMGCEHRQVPSLLPDPQREHWICSNTLYSNSIGFNNLYLPLLCS